MLFLPAVAHAQEVNQTTRDTEWTITVTHPYSSSDGFNVECAYPTPGCQQFNRAMCDIANVPFELTVARASNSPTFSGTPGQWPVYAWLQKNGSTCSNYIAPTTDANSTLVMGIPTSRNTLGQPVVAGPTQQGGSVFYANGSGLDIPFGIAAGAGMTTQDIMKAFPGVCDPNGGINFTFFRVCFGVSTNQFIGQSSTGTATPTTGGGVDVTGWWQFPVDTMPPAVPVVESAKSLVSRVDLNISFASDGVQDMYQLNVRFTSDPNLIAIDDCNAWGTAQSTSVDVATTDTSTTVTIPGVNGTQYAYCAAGVDQLGNVSAYSAVAKATPHPECDYFDCYPGDLQVGFCAAGLPPEWYALAVTAWLYRRSRRRQA